MASFCTSPTIFSFNRTGAEGQEETFENIHWRKVKNATSVTSPSIFSCRWPWTEKSKQIFTDGQIHRWNIFKGKLAQVVWNLVNLTKQIIQQNVNWGRYIIFNSTGNGGTNEIYGNWNKMLQIKLLRQTLKSSKQFYSLLSTDLFSFPSLFVCVDPFLIVRFQFLFCH